MNFFTHFPRAFYTFTSEDGTPFRAQMTNITTHIRVHEAVKARTSSYHDYVVADGERPDTVATKVYGGAEFTWLVLVVNNILTLFDWPLTSDEFTAYLTEKYGSESNAASQKVYFTADGYRVDYATWLTLADGDRGSEKTMYDVELDANEAKRRIKIVPAQFLGPLVTELKKVLA